TSTTKRSGKSHHKEEVIIRLSIGEIIGQKVIIPNLPWTAFQDPNEQIPPDRNSPEPNPLPLLNNVTIFTFLGVPYAEPPLGERRFKAPQQLIHLPGDSPFIAFTLPPVCAQDIETKPTLFINSPYPYQINEDCLYLNIYTPTIASVSESALPVIVFFHGGNFQTGSANDWPGHVLASHGIVVVNVNYRLGPFGFMSLGDEKGNYGIKDQRVALNWVRQHISAFGGDPNAVTIVGHDAGAVSAGIHMLSPLSRNLFRSVVAMSGSEVSYHSTIGKPSLAFNNTIKLGRYLGCVHPVANEVWNCILTRSTDDIVQAVSPTNIEFNRYLFLPTVDGKELLAHPLWLLNNVKNGLSNPFTVPYLTGINTEDGIEAILEDRTLGEFTDFLQITHLYMRSWIIEYTFRHNYTMNREAIIEAIESFYTYWPDPSDVWKIRKNLLN
ncbi:COesterase domain-containing protein, partial [Meloidogyne graminicola]